MSNDKNKSLPLFSDVFRVESSTLEKDTKKYIVSVDSYYDYDETKRKQQWQKYRQHISKETICSMCKNLIISEAIVLDNGCHVCYRCWMNKPTIKLSEIFDNNLKTKELVSLTNNDNEKINEVDSSTFYSNNENDYYDIEIKEVVNFEKNEDKTTSSALMVLKKSKSIKKKASENNDNVDDIKPELMDISNKTEESITEEKQINKKNALKVLKPREIDSNNKEQNKAITHSLDEANNKPITSKINVEDNDYEYAVEMIDICKSFLNGKVIANDHINLRVKKNEVHVIIGENGAGKSTLMSILFGIYSPDSGTIKINGKNVYFSSAKDASAAGLGMVHQHFKLIPTYSVFENIILGSEETGKLGLLKTIKPKKKVESLIKQYNFNLNPNIKISNLSVGQQQKTEILKLLFRDSNILIFDEPTAVLSLDEIEQFLNMIRQLKAEGKTIILITHKFAEIKSVADRATIIRNGKFISEFNVKDKTIEEMANDMVGKKIAMVKNDDHTPFGEVVLSVKNLKINNQSLPNSLWFLFRNKEIWQLRKNNQKMLNINKKLVDLEKPLNENTKEKLKNEYNEYFATCEHLKANFRNRYNKKIEILKKKTENSNLKDRKIENTKFKLSQQKSILFNFNKEFSSKQTNQIINFEVHAGEVFAIGGVEGNGQSELALIIAGLIKNKNAEIHLLDKDISNLSINKRYQAGLSHVPEDRHKYGLILDDNIYMNFVLNRISERPNSKYGFINEWYIKEDARHLIKKFDVRGTTRGTAPARLLSGGNQQKIIIARELTNDHRLIIMVQPTRGLDLGAIEYIHNKVIEEKNKGNAILLISYELDEILALADTIAIIYNGSFIGVGNKKEMTREKIGKLMAGEV